MTEQGRLAQTTVVVDEDDALLVLRRLGANAGTVMSPPPEVAMLPAA